MKRTLQRALLIVAVSAAAGLLVNRFSPRRIPYIAPPQAPLAPGQTLTVEEAKELWDSGGAVFLDARAPADFARGHIPEAINLPVDSFADVFANVAPSLRLQGRLVIYCDGVECDLSHRLAERLEQLGFSDVRILVNGWTVWRTAGYPTKSEGAL